MTQELMRGLLILQHVKSGTGRQLQSAGGKENRQHIRDDLNAIAAIERLVEAKLKRQKKH